HGLDNLDWPENIKQLQRNWIGRSEGASILFRVEKADQDIEVFTTRPDTLFGATYLVLSPEHPLVKHITTPEQLRAVSKYQVEATKKSDLDRTDLAKDKTGVFTGAFAINPVNEKKIPIWVADYVLSSYGTGAIMAVPAHDERDYEFAKKFKLPITQVIAPLYENTTNLKVRNDLPLEKRRLIYGIVRNPKDDTYLCLDWRDQSWQSFVVGGIEQGENPVDAAQREILEETGYQHVKFVTQVEWEVHTKFYAPHKNENRYGVAVGIVFDLIDEKRKPVSDEEKKKHEAKWVAKKQVRDFVTHGNAKFIWDNYLRPTACVGDGVMVNSGQFDGMESTEFKKKVVEWLRSKSGEKHPTCLVVHGIGGHKRENWFPWLKMETAKFGWETIVPTMPGEGHPTLELWNAFLHQYDQKIHESSVLVGHSLGCASILYYLQESGKKVDTVIFVAPTNPLQDWAKLKKEYPDYDWGSVEEMNQTQNFNWKKIRTQVKHFIVVHSDNDPYIPVGSMVYYKEKLPEVEINLIHGKYHFSEAKGIKSIPEILPFFPKRKAEVAVNYKLRDWLFSRQRYWGEPIPIVHCDTCGTVPVPEEDLPLELPNVKKYEPTGTGESPLASIEKWVNTKCPQCGGQAKRETNTMPQWAGSNWYFLRYVDPKNDKQLADPEKLKQWLPVDLYVGGAEHAVLHLLYARFIYKFLYDIGVVPKDCGEEPFVKLKNQGLILGEDNQKMSKSRGNVVNPDEVIKKYGADAIRMYEMFMGPFEDAKPWNTNGIVGVKRFLDRVWGMVHEIVKNRHTPQTQSDPNALRKMNQLIEKISYDIENFKFNTAVSTFMEYSNYLRTRGNFSRIELSVLLTLMYPFAPHITSELNEILQKGNQINKVQMWDLRWPKVDKSKLTELDVTYAIQVNGKLRDMILMSAEASQSEVVRAAQVREKVKKYLAASEPRKVIFVPKKLINFVL
ncbi:MAG: alpha/beta fold hydrolase, partial [Patescibacteria group bacterium]